MLSLPHLPMTLVIYPSTGALADAHLGDAALSGATTFENLMTALGAHIGWRLIGGWVPELLVRRLLQQGDASQPQGLWAAAGADVWGVRAVAQALLTVRRAGITATALAGHPGSAAWLCLAQLLGDYEAALEAQHCDDAADRERQAVLAAATCQLPAGLQQLRRIEVACGSEVFGARLDLLNAFAASGLQVRLNFPWDGDRPHAFAWPEAMAHAVEVRGHPGLEVVYADRVGTGALAPLRAAQFTAQTLPDLPVDLLEVPDDSDHLAHCLQQVAAWVRSGVPVDRIAVVLPDMAGDATGVAAADLATALVNAGVPARCPVPRSAWEGALARGLIVLMTLAERASRGLDRHDLAQVWRLWGKPVARPSGDAIDVASVARWLAAVPFVRVRPGTLRQVLAQAVVGHSGRRSQQDVACVAEAVEAFIAEILAWPGQAPLVVHVTCALTWLERVSDAPEHGAGAIACRTALEAIVPASQHAGDDGLWGRAECSSWFTAILQGAELPAAGRGGAQVTLLAPDKIVARQFSHVLLVGGNTGVFPRVEAPDAVLTDALRAELNAQLGPRLIQYAPLSGRGALPAEARDLWLWLELLLACTSRLAITVICSPGEGHTGESDVIEALRRTGAPTRHALRPSYLTPVPATPAQWVLHAAARSPIAPPPQHVVATLPEAWGSRWAWARRRADNRDLHDSGRLPRLPPAIQQAWRAHLQSQVHAVSHLDSLGICRYRHWAGTGLGLQRPEAAQLALGAAGRGRVAHAALHAVYRALRASGGLAAARRDPPAAWARARAAFAAAQQDILAEANLHILLRPAVLLDAWHAVEVQLTVDLEAEDTEPVALEYTFGKRADGSAPPLRVTVPEADIELLVRGTIDRVDAASNGLHTLDYKSTLRKREAGRHFQLGLYAAVALRDLQAAPSALHTVWRSLWENKRQDAVDRTQAPSPADFLPDLQRAMGARLAPSLAGDVAPDPDVAASCNHCDYLALCRYRSADLESDTDADVDAAEDVE